MTTIAWDGKTLAVDSRAVSGHIITSDSCKKIFLDVGRYAAVAIAGDHTELLDFMEWLKNGEKGDAPKAAESCQIIGITKKGKCHTYFADISGKPQIENHRTAGGSGWLIALSAMDAGATAEEAVKISRKRDINTGGRIQSYTHSDERKILRPAKRGALSRKQVKRAVKSAK